MDSPSVARRLPAAIALAAGFVACLEAAAVASMPGVPGSALPWLLAATFGLSALALALLGLLLAPLLVAAGRVRWLPETLRTPRARRGLALLALLLAIALQVANARLYVRLYAAIHALLSGLTLLFALLGWLLLLASRERARAGEPWPASRAQQLAAGAVWLLTTSVSVGWVLADDALRAHALEQATLLDDELRVLDRVTSVLAYSQMPEPRSAALDPALRDAVSPQPLLAPSGAARGAHVVLVTIDSLRADRWLAGGAAAERLPSLEALGRQGVRFARAYAPSCWTVHSVSAMLWSRLPSQLRFAHVGVLPGYRFAVFDDDSEMVRDARNAKKVTPIPARGQEPSLIARLRAAGYQTATVAAYIYYFRDAGLTAEFEYVDEDGFRERGIGTSGIAPVPMVERARLFLEQRDTTRPFLLWLHFMEPHAPYDARDPAAEGGNAEARYESELRYADAQLAALRAELEQRGLDRTALWVVHADHGEEFGDHGGAFHASALYEETVRVPLLVRLPAASAVEPRVVETPVSLLDVAPTLLDALGVPSETELMGRSLVPALRGEPLPERPLLMECERFAARKRAYLRWPFKLIVDRGTGTAQLFALHLDPKERSNLASREPLLRQAMAAELAELERVLVP